MTVFVDTSAFYASIDAADDAHDGVAAAWRRLAGERLATHSYVVVETVALVQRRLGMTAVRDLVDELLLPVEVTWVDRDLHTTAATALLAAGRKGLSLVDHTSFELMRRRGITAAFAVDPDFSRQGFETIP